jgi:hypothetical protein
MIVFYFHFNEVMRLYVSVTMRTTEVVLFRKLGKNKVFGLMFYFYSITFQAINFCAKIVFLINTTHSSGCFQSKLRNFSASQSTSRPRR